MENNGQRLHQYHDGLKIQRGPTRNEQRERISLPKAE